MTATILFPRPEAAEEERYPLVGASAASLQARDFIRLAIRVSSPVLLLGPSGVGKEVIARSIHSMGPTPHAPFVAINCAAVNASLAESELFGYEKGAFTGAAQAAPGKLELAAGGTLFLDEVGELTPALQAKLLRVLQEREFYRVGGTRQYRFEARLIAATNRDLAAMVRDGTFREDLHYRLKILDFRMPPLKERPEDIAPLLHHFMAHMERQMQRTIRLSPEAESRLLRYRYPGNVREMKNIVERIFALNESGTVVDAASLPAECAGDGEPLHAERRRELVGVPLPIAVAELEERLIRRAMSSVGNRQKEAAALLKISRGALQYKLRKYGLADERR